MSKYARLSSPIDNIQDHYTVVVVGSGYGGGIAASRLARAGQQVCLLERGKERQPGEFPRTQRDAIEEIQLDTAAGHVNGRTKLLDMRLYEDINVLVGNGLGGTSLINANVSIEADPRVFDDERWPPELRADLSTLVKDGYRRAREMLRPRPIPEPPIKARALARSAEAMGATVHHPDLNVTFDELPGGVNHVGVEQPPCVRCGDCITGCNYGSKNTTLATYLPDAVNHGAEIYTEVEVRRVSRGVDGSYVVHYRILGAGREAFDAPESAVSADVVILAAGTLGSTEILLRSQAAGLPTSACVGDRFTGNGDVLGFGYNCDEKINGVGWGARAGKHLKDGRPRDPSKGVGPCITSCIDLRGTPDLDQGMLIEEGALPGPIACLTPAALAAGSKLVGSDTDKGFVDKVREIVRTLVGLVAGPYHGAMQHTQTYLVMTHEQTSGRIVLDGDRVTVTWPGVGKEPIFQQVNDRLYEATKALGGIYVRNPLWTDVFKHDLVTVHPLGGCVMGDRADTGVVNHKGQVFSGVAGEGVHGGLYVADGSVIPRPLGCNPLLTISAIAERTCALIAADRGWTIDYTLPSRPRSRPPAAHRTVGIEFTERMAGHFSKRVFDDYLRAEQDGRDTGSTFEFILTIVAEDLDRLVTDETYESGMIGTVRAPALSAHPLSVTEGRFTLLSRDPQHEDAKNMHYRMKLTSLEGAHYWFEGTKFIKDDPGFDVWADSTTLYITVSEGAEPGGTLLGCGVLHIKPTDFFKQLRATRAINAQGRAARLAAVARFGSYFAGNLWNVYKGAAG